MAARADACLIDLDGTVWEDGRAIACAAAAVAAVRRAGLTVRFLSNTTRRPRSALIESLERTGIEARIEEVVTAPSAAASWLARRGVRRVSLLLAAASFEDFPGFEIDDEKPQAVVVGDLGDAWTFEILDRAFRALVSGAELVALQKNRYWKTGGRLSLDAGPFVAALEYAAGTEARVVGKPSPELFHTVTADLGVRAHRLVMVGDDLEADVVGARAAGLQAVALRTGKYRREDEDRAQATATAVLDSIADLPVWLGLGG